MLNNTNNVRILKSGLVNITISILTELSKYNKLTI